MVENRPPMPELGFIPEKINGNFKGKDILYASQFDKESLEMLFALTPEMEDIAKNSRESKILAGTMTVLLFYEPSTRTKVSFDTGIQQLGGRTSSENTKDLSEAKGEPFRKTILTIEAYCDAIVLRHPDVNSVGIAADAAKFIPIISAGNGPGDHPTQMVLDLYTIKKHKGTLSGLKGVFARDIKNGRTVHSNLEALSLYPNNTVYLLSDDELRLDRELIEKYTRQGLKIIEIRNESQIPKDCDFWYWTRIQDERFKGNEKLEQKLALLERKFVIDEEFLDMYCGKETIVLHPQPIRQEITERAQKDPRMVIEEQVRNGQYTRMVEMGLVFDRL